jgi:hypothetical protein
VLIQNWESFLGKLSIPVTEDRLLEIYHSVLTERGVADYPLGAVQGRLRDGAAATGQPPGHPSPPSASDLNI